MDDGYKHSSGVSLCTDSYTKEEVLLLINILKNKFNLNSNLMKHGVNNFRIYIKKESIENLKTLVKPYFIPSMLYKLN